MEVYGVFKGQVLTAPPDVRLNYGVKMVLETFASEEMAWQSYNTYTKRLIDIDGVLMGHIDRFSGVLLITKQIGRSGSVFKYNDHQDELGQYLGEMIIDPL